MKNVDKFYYYIFILFTLKSYIEIELEVGLLGFVEGKNRRTWRKTIGTRTIINIKLNPLMMWDTLVGG